MGASGTTTTLIRTQKEPGDPLDVEIMIGLGIVILPLENWRVNSPANPPANPYDGATIYGFIGMAIDGVL